MWEYEAGIYYQEITVTIEFGLKCHMHDLVRTGGSEWKSSFSLKKMLSTLPFPDDMYATLLIGQIFFAKKMLVNSESRYFL